MIVATAESIRPPERLTVSQAAVEYRKLNIPGGYVGPWKNETTPYMVEFQDVLNSTAFTAGIFVGPAQCAKTDILLNWITYTAMCDPADLMVIQTSQSTARDFAKRRVERLFRHSEKVGARRMPGRQNQNTYDTKFLSGWLLSLAWPTINELSGKPIPRLWLTDYDRMPEDIDHEGSPFDLAKKRATTFGRNGMTVAESSPGYDVENPKWVAKTAHEAPPAKGILALYNRGDRRRFYWRCVGCGRPFEGSFKLLSWPDTRDFLEAGEMATIDCPYCHHSHTHESGPGQPGKYGLNLGGRWVRDGMVWMPEENRITGAPFRSEFASFWLKGPAAAFADWKTLVFNYLTATQEYETTGSFQALKTTVNTDQGEPFIPVALDGERLPEDLKAQAKDYGEKVVPDGVRFLIATVDVQKNKFVVQVHGFGVNGDVWIVDRFDIRKAERLDDDGEHYWVSPGVYEEDWRLLVGAVIEKTYPLGDGSGRHMMVKAIGADMHGREGVSTNAYNFWRWLRDEHPAQHHRRFQLLRGDPTKSAPRTRITFPDSDRKDRRAGARGEVPVLQISPDKIKDQVAGMLGRQEIVNVEQQGQKINGVVHYPDWLEDWWFSEMTAETRTSKGWENPKNHRNEAWDLLCYAIALALTRHARIETIDWEKPPSWARPWDENDLVFMPEENATPFSSESKLPATSLAELGDSLG